MLANAHTDPPFDSTFPGENWFYYFKTSASLWRSKLENIHHGHIVMVPIYWAFHSENGKDIDFGQNRPEANLAILSRVAKESGKELIFMVPLGPFPFLSNGGIPPTLARTLSLDENQKAQVLVDNDGKLNKLYSFFDPRLYQSYRYFLHSLSEYFEKEGVNAEVVGAYTGYTDENGFHSYMEDYSKAFEIGLSRYLSLSQKANEQKSLQNNEPAQNLGNNPLAYEQSQKYEYIKTMEDLYLTSAKEAFPHLWSGTLKFSFLGGAPKDLLTRGVQGQDVSSLYMRPLLETITYDTIPSSVLLPPEAKKGPLGSLLSEFVNSCYIEKKLDNKIYQDDLSIEFTPLLFFELYQNPLWNIAHQKIWENIGLTHFLNNQYKWTYLLSSSLKHLDSYDVVNEKILILSGHMLAKKEFQILQKVLMNGGRILLDKTGLSPDLERKLELFFLENSVKIEKFNYISQVTHAQFGAGKLFVFEGKKILEAPVARQFSFWENLFTFMGPIHLKIIEDQDIYYYWKTRSPKPSELSYHEIRRICLYNPSSYKRKVRILPGPNFAFLKFSGAINAKIESTSIGVTIDMLPGASVALDFGHFET